MFQRKDAMELEIQMDCRRTHFAKGVQAAPPRVPAWSATPDQLVDQVVGPGTFFLPEQKDIYICILYNNILEYNYIIIYICGSLWIRTQDFPMHLWLLYPNQYQRWHDAALVPGCLAGNTLASIDLAWHTRLCQKFVTGYSKKDSFLSKVLELKNLVRSSKSGVLAKGQHGWSKAS